MVIHWWQAPHPIIVQYKHSIEGSIFRPPRLRYAIYRLSANNFSTIATEIGYNYLKLSPEFVLKPCPDYGFLVAESTYPRPTKSKTSSRTPTGKRHCAWLYDDSDDFISQSIFRYGTCAGQKILHIHEGVEHEFSTMLPVQIYYWNWFSGVKQV